MTVCAKSNVSRILRKVVSMSLAVFLLTAIMGALDGWGQVSAGPAILQGTDTLAKALSTQDSMLLTLRIMLGLAVVNALLVLVILRLQQKPCVLATSDSKALLAAFLYDTRREWTREMKEQSQ